MKTEKPIVHFGCGALGRGLVMPLLYQSKKTLIAVDTNKKILEQIHKDGGYDLLISDREDPKEHVEVLKALSSITQQEELIEILKNADTVTTSVKRENLKYLVPVILKAWGDDSCRNKVIISCENVENVGYYFKNLLMKQCDEKQKANVQEIKIPNTIVDRICSMNSEDMTIVSEEFHELSVDKNVLSETGIEYIDSIDNMEGHFYRKRYLLNSYADAISFLAKKVGLTYLYEAAQNEKINEQSKPYMELLKDLLHEKYHISKEELEQWQEIYRKRLQNDKIPRELTTVARNLWSKLTVEERFVKPLIQLLEMKKDISEGVKFIKKLIECGTEDEQSSQIKEKLMEIWNVCPEGEILFNMLDKISD